VANLTEYILLRKENDSLNSLIGQSFNQKSKFEAETILDEIHSKAQSRMIGKKALCYIVDKNEIKGVGGSTMMKDKDGKIISNLILDQFGIFLAKITGRNAGGQRLINIKDILGTNHNLEIYSVSNVVNFNRTTAGARGFLVQIGSGSVVPARTDFKINTAFGVAPENTQFNAVSDPVYNSGLGNFKYIASITAGGAGTINESIGMYNWVAQTNVAKLFCAFRDIISPSVSFIVGQSIVLEYTVQL